MYVISLDLAMSPGASHSKACASFTLPEGARAMGAAEIACKDAWEKMNLVR